MESIQSEIKSKIEQLASAEQSMKSIEQSMSTRMDKNESNIGSRVEELITAKQSMESIQSEIKSKIEQLASAEQSMKSVESKYNEIGNIDKSIQSSLYEMKKIDSNLNERVSVFEKSFEKQCELRKDSDNRISNLTNELSDKVNRLNKSGDLLSEKMSNIHNTERILGSEIDRIRKGEEKINTTMIELICNDKCASEKITNLEKRVNDKCESVIALHQDVDIMHTNIMEDKKILQSDIEYIRIAKEDNNARINNIQNEMSTWYTNVKKGEVQMEVVFNKRVEDIALKSEDCVHKIEDKYEKLRCMVDLETAGVLNNIESAKSNIQLQNDSISEMGQVIVEQLGRVDTAIDEKIKSIHVEKLSIEKEIDTKMNEIKHNMKLDITSSFATPILEQIDLQNENMKVVENRIQLVESKQSDYKESMDELCEITQLNTEYIRNVHDEMSEITSSRSVTNDDTHSISSYNTQMVNNNLHDEGELWMSIKVFLETCCDSNISQETCINTIGLDSISMNEFVEFIYNQIGIRMKFEDIYNSVTIADLLLKYEKPKRKELINKQIENTLSLEDELSEICEYNEKPVPISTPKHETIKQVHSEESSIDTLAYYTKIDKNGSSMYIRGCTKNEILYHENMKNQFAIPVEILTLDTILKPTHFGYAVAYVEKYFPVVRAKIVEQNGHYIEINMDKNNCIKVIFTEMRMHGNQDGMYSVVNNYFDNNNNPFQNNNLIIFVIINSIQKKTHLVMTYHHAFYDGVSLARIQDTLLNSYCDSVRNDKYKVIKVQGLPLGIEHIIQCYDTSDAGLEDSESIMKTMQAALHPQSKSNCIPRLLLNETMFGDTVGGIVSQHVQHINFSAENTKYARSLSQQYNISFYSYMCAVVMNTLSKIHDEDIHLVFWGITNARNIMSEKIDSGCHILFNMIDVNAEKGSQLWPLATKIHIQWATKTSNVERMCTRQKIMIGMLDSMFSIIPNMSLWGDEKKVQIMVIYLGVVNNKSELQVKKKDVVIQFRNLKYPCLCFYFSMLDDILHCSISGNIPFVNVCKIASIMKDVGLNMC